MKPLYALHKDKAGRTLGAHSFDDDYQLGAWVRALDLRDGDSLVFGEKTERPEFDEVERPSFLRDDDELPRPKTPELADDEQPF